MANFYVDPPDELEDDNNVNISNLHRTLNNLIKQLNFGMINIDTDNFTDEVADAIDSIVKGEE